MLYCLPQSFFKKKTIKIRFRDDSNVQETIFGGHEKFKNKTFLPICDTIIVCLNEKKNDVAV